MTEPPNLPVIRTSERKTFKECQQKWWWAYRMGLKPRGREAIHFWFGTGVHLALAEWYKGPGLKRGPHPAKTWIDYCRDEVEVMNTAGPGEDPKWTGALDLGIAMLEGYVEKWGRDSDWDIIAPEQTFKINIPYRRKDGIQAIYVGTFDLVFRRKSDGTIWLGEHKTAKAISLDHLPLDDQAGSYWAVASDILRAQGLLNKGQYLEGIMYNFLKKQMPDDRPENEHGEKLNLNGSVSKRQPGPLFVREPVTRDRRERQTQIRRIQNEASWMGIARRHPDSITKTPTTSCARGCQFYTMCTLHEKGGDDWDEYRKAMFVTRDPYADHRKSTEE